MSTVFSLFPTLNGNMKSRIRFQPEEYKFFYTNNHQETGLEHEPVEGMLSTFKMTDSLNWNADDFNWGFSRKYVIKTYNFLFGSEGIAPQGAVLGLAAIWTSSESRQRGVIDIGELRYSEEDRLELSAYKVFLKAQLRGMVDISTVIYVKSPADSIGDKESHLANRAGIVLGELDKISIIMDGDGSVFPIYEFEDTSQPLWYVNCEWEDPTYEKFSDSVSIYINRKHKNYKYVDKKSKYFDEQLIKEIISSSIMIIIQKVKDSGYWIQTENGENLEIGSVSQALYYFINTLKWDTTTTESLSVSMRRYMDEQI